MSSVELKGLKGLRSLDSLMNELKEPQGMLLQLEKLPIEFLVPGKYQPRKHMDEAVLSELADSIKTQGIIQPLIVRKVEQGRYEIIAGERRWRAAKIAGLTNVPVIIRDIEDNVAIAFALIENIQREDLNPIEEAVAFARFRDEFSMTHDEIAHSVGRSRASVTNALRLLSLSDPVRQLLEESKIDMGHARALLSLPADQQIETARKVIDNQLTVRDVESLVNATREPSAARHQSRSSFQDEQCEHWSRTLSEKFSAKVCVKLNSNGSAKVVIHVDSPDEIDWLVEHVVVE